MICKRLYHILPGVVLVPRLGWFWQLSGGRCCVEELRSPTGYLGRWTLPEDETCAEDLRADWVQRSVKLRSGVRETATVLSANCNTLE